MQIMIWVHRIPQLCVCVWFYLILKHQHVLQFALHYSWSTEARARRALANISAILRPGGTFIGTMPDANVIIKKLREGFCFVPFKYFLYMGKNLKWLDLWILTKKIVFFFPVSTNIKAQSGGTFIGTWNFLLMWYLACLFTLYETMRSLLKISWDDDNWLRPFRVNLFEVFS